MSSLLLSSVVFVVVQLLLATVDVRRALDARIGRGAARGVLVLAALCPLAWLANRYSAAFVSGNSYLWYLGDLPQQVAAPVMSWALFLVVSGLLAQRASTPAARAGTPRSLPPVVGIVRITRHPVLCGIVTWSAFHMFANGDVASLLFFGSFLVSGLLVMWLRDRQHFALCADYARYAEQTSSVPFVAILRGKNSLSWRELGFKPLLLTLLAFSLVVSFHPRLFGAYPLPGMDD